MTTVKHLCNIIININSFIINFKSKSYNILMNDQQMKLQM